LYNKTVYPNSPVVTSPVSVQETINVPPQACLTTDVSEIYTDRAVLISDSLLESEDFSDTDESSDEE
jgi:hypothetical protein